MLNWHRTSTASSSQVGQTTGQPDLPATSNFSRTRVGQGAAAFCGSLTPRYFHGKYHNICWLTTALMALALRLRLPGKFPIFCASVSFILCRTFIYSMSH